MPKRALPLTLAGVSSRRVRLPTMRKSFGSFSGGFCGTGSFAAAAASSPKVALRPPGPLTTPLPGCTCSRGTLQRSAAALASISRTWAPATRSFSQPSRTDVEPPVSCVPPIKALP